MPSTYTPIATQTLGSSTATVTFSSISGSYTDLVLVCSSIGTGAVDAWVQFNSDAGTNYSVTRLMGDGTSATSNRGTSRNGIDINYVGSINSTAPTTSILNIMNYSNTTTYKTALVRANEMGGTYNGTEAFVGLWRSTSAITSVSILARFANIFAAGSTFTLYGVKSA